MERNQNNQQKEKQNVQNSNTKSGNREFGRNKRYPQGRNHNSDSDNAMKGRDSIKFAKGKEQKTAEKQYTKNTKSHQNKSYKTNLGAASGRGSRYGRNTSRSANPNEILAKSITTKRIETVEDIQADIERIDKEIQFEIKQIKAIKLGI